MLAIQFTGNKACSWARECRGEGPRHQIGGRSARSASAPATAAAMLSDWPARFAWRNTLFTVSGARGGGTGRSLHPSPSGRILHPGGAWTGGRRRRGAAADAGADLRLTLGGAADLRAGADQRLHWPLAAPDPRAGVLPSSDRRIAMRRARSSSGSSSSARCSTAAGGALLSASAGSSQKLLSSEPPDIADWR